MTLSDGDANPPRAAIVKGDDGDGQGDGHYRPPAPDALDRPAAAPAVPDLSAVPVAGLLLTSTRAPTSPPPPPPAPRSPTPALPAPLGAAAAGPEMSAAALESPEPRESFPPGDESLPTESALLDQTPKGRQRYNGLPTMEERLQMMPEKRQLPWRQGVEPGADLETGGDSRRKQIRFGCLLATRGDVVAVPCHSCAKGRGKFSLCINLDGYFKGACASCQLSGRPNRCSIKKSDDSKEAPEAAISPEWKISSYNPSTRSPQSTPQMAAQMSMAAGHHHPAPIGESPKAKRRKTSAVTGWGHRPPQWEPPPGGGEPLTRTQMDEPNQRPWVTVNPPGLIPLQPAQTPVKDASGLPRLYASHERPLSWATVNQSPLAHSPSIPLRREGEEGGGGGIGGTEGGGSRNGAEKTEEDPSAISPLMLSLPKHKQTLMYGIVSGIQGGIESLQQELNQLKRALGIEDQI